MPHFPAKDPPGLPANLNLTRRLLLTGIGATALSACSPTLEMPSLELDDFTTGSIPMRPQISIDKGVTSSEVMYASFADEGFVLPAIPSNLLAPYLRDLEWATGRHSARECGEPRDDAQTSELAGERTA